MWHRPHALRALRAAAAPRAAISSNGAALRSFASLPSWATVDPQKLSGAHPGEGFNLGACFCHFRVSVTVW